MMETILTSGGILVALFLLGMLCGYLMSISLGMDKDAVEDIRHCANHKDLVELRKQIVEMESNAQSKMRRSHDKDWLLYYDAYRSAYHNAVSAIDAMLNR